MIAFAISNGLCCTMLFSLGPGLVSDELKGKAGSCLSFFLITGIFVGSVYANFITQPMCK